MTTLVSRVFGATATVTGLFGLVCAIGAAWQLFGLLTTASPTTLAEFLTWAILTAVVGGLAWGLDSVAQWTEG
jgi:hypothetical protein